MDLMANLRLKGLGDSSMPGKQRPREGVKAGCCEIRTIWQKLDCLKSNLRSVNVRAHRNDVCNRCRPVRQYCSPADATSVGRVMPSEGSQGDEWVA